MPDPVLIVMYDKDVADGSCYGALGYCDLTFARKFDVTQYAEFLNLKIPAKALTRFESIECFLVDKQNVLAAFDF